MLWVFSFGSHGCVTCEVTFVLKKLLPTFAGTRASPMHGFEDVGEAGLRELLLQCGLRRSEDLLQGCLNAVPDRTGLVGPLRVRRKRLIGFHRLIHGRQSDAS